MPSVRGLQNVCHSQNLQKLYVLPFVAKFALFVPLAFFALTLFFPALAHAQRINISNFYYRDYLDFGQNKGVFKDGAEQNGAFTLIGKDGEALTIPRIPTFQASSNYGSLTSIGRGFAVTANHVTSPTDSSQGALRNWGLTKYEIANQSVQTSEGDINGTSKQYGYDEKFLRFTKYIVEGQVGMLDFDNSTKKQDSTKTTQDKNIEQFKTKLNGLETNSDGNVYIYQAGSGGVTLRGTDSVQKFDTSGSGEMKGGGFGYFRKDGIQYGCYYDSSCENIGMFFYYFPNIEKDFNNRITGGDSGSGIYAYDKTNSKWVLVGVVSKEWEGQNRAFISAVSQKDFRDYQKNFEQEIKIVKNSGLSLERTGASPVQLKGNDTAGIFSDNKDIIFRGSGEINIEVKTDIDRTQSGYAGGFVFENSDSTKSATFKFTNQAGQNHFFKGSGLDIGENVSVEWALKTNKGDSLHKVGKGTLTIKTANTDSTGLGNLKLGEGKVVLDTSNKAFENIYITSGRGELALTKDKAEALGATKNSTTARGDSINADSYTLKQDSTSAMGFYFGTGGGKLDLGGNSLTLNTIAANDKNAIVTNTSGSATLTIEGLGYKDDGKDKPKVKDTTKANTIIHASVGDANSNIDLQYSGNNTTNAQSATNTNNAHLIFDGNINTNGKMSVSNGNVALQGHATAHATISDEKIRGQVKTAESGTSKAMPDYMDLEKPSTLTQPDWDNRIFKFGTGGIALTNSTLTLGRNASLESTITLDSSSKVEFGGGVAHFIDNLDGKNVTGSGFSYQQKVEHGNLTGEALKGANESISYKGKITANGGEIKSSIWDFNASLDLKSDANLTADYLTLNSSSSVSLESSASATIQNLKLQNVSESNLNAIFTNSGGKLEVKKSIWFDSSTLNLNNLDSAHFTKPTQYDIIALNGSQVSGDSLAFQNVVLLQGGDSSTTKLTLTDNLKAESLDSATIELRGKSEIEAPKIEFSSVKNGNLILDGESKLTLNSGVVEVKGTDSMLNIALGGGEKSFNINASGAGTNITLKSVESSSDSTQSASFKGKITAKDASVVASALESITASVDLSGTAQLTAQNIVLDSTHNSISLSGNSTLTADKITAKNVSNLTLQTNGATASVGKFIFDGGTTNLTGNLIGDKITLQNASVVKNGDLSFGGDVSVDFSDKDSKLEVTNLKVTSGNLVLNFHDSKQNADKITKIDLSGGNVNINAWDFGNATNFQSNGGGRVTFGSASYTQNGNAKTINADSTISGALSLSSVGKKQSNNANFEALKFSDKNLTLGVDSTISVVFDSSIKKSDYSTAGITLGAYYTLISTGGIVDNRANKIIDFTFSNPNDALFVAYKIIGDDLKIKFTESDPHTFSELNKHINPRYSEVLKALTEAHPSDFAIEVATNTDDYAVLESRVSGIDRAMNEIAQGNKSRVTRNLLFSNEHTINTRISQVRLARASHNKSPLRFAQDGTLYRLQKMKGEAVASDAMPSYATNPANPAKNGDLLPNNAWLNVGGGYFGGDSQMGFGATNIGYDRLFNADSGDVLVGAMLGFGGALGVSGAMSENARFYNVGIYTHAIIDARGGIYGGHEIQGNVNVSVSENSKRFKGDSSALGGGDSSVGAWDAQSADSVAFGMLLTLYYKYNFIVASDENISHAVKPVALFSVGYNRNGAFKSAEYRQSAYASANLSYGLGVEYNAVMNASFYSISAVIKDNAYNSGGRVEVSLNGARNFIGYTIDSAPRINAEVSVVGSHRVFELGGNGRIGANGEMGDFSERGVRDGIGGALYVQYGITGMVDMGGNYGIKGDVKVGWKF